MTFDEEFVKENLYVRDRVFEGYDSAMNVNYFSEKKLNVKEIQGGLILPVVHFFDETGLPRYRGGVVDENLNFVQECSHQREVLDRPFSFDLIEGYQAEEYLFDEREVMYGGIIFDHFGHFLIESLSRMWAFIADDETKFIAFIETSERKKPFVDEFFELLKIPKDRVILVKEPTKFKKVVVPESSFAIRNYFTKEYIAPYRKMSESVDAKPFEKVYLTRTKVKSGPKFYGEKYLEKFFKKNGYEIIAPETMSLREQISCLKGAKSIGAILGTASHLVLFAQEGCELILLNRSDTLNNNQIAINQANKIRCTRIDGHMNFLQISHTDGPFLMGLSEKVVEFAEESGFAYDKKDKSKVGFGIEKRFLKDWFLIYSQEYLNNWLDENIRHYAGIYFSIGNVRAKNKFKKKKDKNGEKLMTKLLENIFSIKNKDSHKILRVLGLKFKFKLKNDDKALMNYLEYKLNRIEKYESVMNTTLNTIFRYQTGLQLNGGLSHLGGTIMERIVVFDPKDAPEDHYERYAFAKKYCEGKKVLDAACGCGYGSKLLSESAQAVLGVDLCEPAINFANKIFAGENCHYICKNANELNLDGNFDVAVSFETIEHIEDPSVMLKTFNKLLNKDGLLICSVPNQSVVPFDKTVFTHHFRHYTKEEICGLLENNGFEIEKISYQYPGHAGGLKVNNIGDVEGHDIVIVAKKKG